MAAGEEGWEIYRDPRLKGERAKCYRTSDQKRFLFMYQFYIKVDSLNYMDMLHDPIMI